MAKAIKTRGNTRSKFRHGSPISHQTEDRQLRQLPPEVRRYIQYDCPINLKLTRILKVANSYTPSILIALIRAQIAADTAAIYGKDHPQAAV